MCFATLEFIPPASGLWYTRGWSCGGLDEDSIIREENGGCVWNYLGTLWIVKLTQHGRYFNKWLNTNSPISWEVLGFDFLSVLFPSCSLAFLPALASTALWKCWGEKVLSSAPLKGDLNRVLTRMPSLTGTDSSSHWELRCAYVCVRGWGVGVRACQISVCIYYEKANIPGEA